MTGLVSSRYQSQNWFREFVQNARGDIEAEVIQRFAVRFLMVWFEFSEDPAVRQRQGHFCRR